MPAHIKKNKDGTYKVLDKEGKVFAKKTTKAKAQKQVKLLNYIWGQKHKK